MCMMNKVDRVGQEFTRRGLSVEGCIRFTLSIGIQVMKYCSLVLVCVVMRQPRAVEADGGKSKGQHKGEIGMEE